MIEEKMFRYQVFKTGLTKSVLAKQKKEQTQKKDVKEHSSLNLNANAKSARPPSSESWTRRLLIMSSASLRPSSPETSRPSGRRAARRCLALLERSQRVLVHAHMTCRLEDLQRSTARLRTR